MHVPVVHYRKQLLPTGILGPGTDTATGTAPLTATATAADVATTTTPTAPIVTDPLGGLTSIIGSIFSTSSDITTTSSSPSPSSSSSSIPTTSSTPTTPTTPIVATTITATPTASPASASSPSASPSATPTTSSTVGIVAGVLIGVLSLALIIGFFLVRPCARAKARESINFNPEAFQKYTEQKTPIYPEAGGYQTSPTPVSYPPEAYSATYTPEPSAYPAEYNMQRQRTPHPHHGYPTAVPTTAAFEYQGSARPLSQQHRAEFPNPHPEYNEEDAYGGI